MNFVKLCIYFYLCIWLSKCNKGYIGSSADYNWLKVKCDSSRGTLRMHQCYTMSCQLCIGSNSPACIIKILIKSDDYVFINIYICIYILPLSRSYFKLDDASHDNIRIEYSLSCLTFVQIFLHKIYRENFWKEFQNLNCILMIFCKNNKAIQIINQQTFRNVCSGYDRDVLLLFPPCEL